MSSPFSDRRRMALLATTALAGVVVCGGEGACGSPPPNQFTAEFRDTNGNCNDAGALEMDTYVIQLIDVERVFNWTTPGGSADCETCLATPGACVLEHPTVCVCSGHVPANSDNLSNTLRGVQFGGLDTADVYCMRVMALDVGRAGTGPAHVCPCQSSYTDATDPAFASAAQMCAIGPPLSLGALQMRMPIRLDVRCAAEPSGGGNNPRATTFGGCITAPTPSM